MKNYFSAFFLISAFTNMAQNNPKIKEFASEMSYNERQEAIFAVLKPGSKINQGEIEDFINSKVLSTSDYKVSLIKTESDEIGFQHNRYEIQYQGVALHNKVIISHSLNGLLRSINGDFNPGLKPENQFKLTEAEGLKAALKKVKAKKYKWENKIEEEQMRRSLNQPNFSYYPKAKKVVFEKEGKNYNAYQFTIYAEIPLYKANVLVDAANGEILEEQNLICNVDVPATALTKYSGTQTMTCDQSGSVYSLKETQRGNGIETYNLNNGTTYANNNFTNTSASWTNTGFDQAATDAHWGAEKTYDYYSTQHNRNSIDNNGFKLLSYVHYNTNYANAFWDGTRMTYGDGNGTSTYIFTTIDICGHEITHGLTSNTSNLNYSNESGALNESYSDIFGTLIENYSRPSNWNWKVGEQMTANGNGIRSMSNPNLFQDPDTYNGQFWYVGTADNGGVHTNSGVSNFWFYLLSVGGSGTNDVSNAYSVSGIGLTSAARIAYRALTLYYTPNTNYAQARTLSIQAAKDLFGNCSNEVTQTANAWYAVGVGPTYIPGVIGPDFIANKTSFCTIPAVVNFNNTTSNGITYTWYFGDGSTATSTNAVHSYTANGNYTVKLKSTGCANGLDSIIKSAYIAVNAPSIPTAIGSGGCANTSLTLSASGSAVIQWYAGSNSTVSIGTGNNFVTPNLSTTTTYYASNTFTNSSANGGMLSNTGGGFLNNAAQWLIFDVTQNSTINSVVVYAQAAGNRTIQLRNASNQVLNTLTSSLSAGANTVNLNFPLAPGTNYQLGLANGSTSNLYRSNTGVNFPYQVAGCVNISGSSAGAGFYYWFYNWQVTEADCMSPLVPVTASILPAPQVNLSATSTLVCSTDLVSLSGNPAGGNYSGNGVSGSNFTANNGAGNYMISYVYSNGGCAGSDSLLIQAAECVGLSNTGNDLNEASIYPNPVKDIFNFHSTASKCSLTIYDAVGKMVYSANATGSDSKHDINHLSKGIYLLEIKEVNTGLIKSYKLIKD